MSLILDDLDPDMFVSTNRRIHHHQRAKLSRYWRDLGATVVRLHYGHAEDGCSWLSAARIVLTLRFPTRHHRDVGNYYTYLAKPLVDGMVTDGRLLAGDDDRYLVGPDLRRDPEQGPHCIRIDIEDI